MKIEIKNLTFRYGTQPVLNNVEFVIPQNGIFGLLGRNGAGKTTLMKLMSGLFQLQSGDILFDKISVKNKNKTKQLVGYLPQNFDFYPNMKVKEVLYYIGMLDEINSQLLKKRIEELLVLVNLETHKEKRIKALSGGMKRRLGIAQCLLNNPPVLILDEPTAGLDPEERIHFRNLFSDLAQTKTIILSTHIASDLESSAEELAILDKGQLLFSGKMEDLLSKSNANTYETIIPFEKLSEMKKEYLIYEQKECKDGYLIRFLSYAKPKDNFIPIGANLESAYMNVLHQKELK